MSLKLGDQVPNFDATTTEGPINFFEWKKDKWAILFSHPEDFTPVCTTELATTALLKPDFDARGVQPIALSVDTVERHNEWVADIEEWGGADVTYPIIADPERKVANLYGMLHPNAADTLKGKLTVRSVFIVDPANKLRLTLTYPAATGRNFHELLRVIDGLQLTDGRKVATPANWKKGEKVVVLPSVSDEDAKKEFGEFDTFKPYLRTTQLK